MILKIIGAILLIAFFVMMTRISQIIVGEDKSISRIFPIASSIMVALGLGMMFLGDV